MAILKSMLEENVLSKSEQAVLRMLTRCAALNEGIVTLNKLDCLSDVVKPSGLSNADIQNKVNEAKNYLRLSIATSLCSYRFPATTTKDTTPQSAVTMK